MRRIILTIIGLVAMMATLPMEAQTVRNSSNMKVGSIESNGTIRNSSNMYIGKIESDGTVRNGSNMTIGSARGVKREHAAVFFFFNQFN